MSTFYGIGSDSVSSLFSSTSSTGTSSILSDFYSIRNGSYKKLLRSYYALDKDDSSSKSSTNAKKTTSTATDSTKTLSSIKSSTDELKASADKLLKTGTKSLFNMKDGEYDVNAIYSAVKSFVEDYNDVIDATEESNTKNIATNSASMITSTMANSKMLSKIGITMETDGKLTLDKTEFMKADMNKVKSLFNGNGSYGYQISAKASMINYYASREAGKANTYTSKGSYSYNYSSGDILNKLY